MSLAETTSMVETRSIAETTVSPGWCTVATFERYADAQRAVDRLIEAMFPVARVSIVGCRAGIWSRRSSGA